MLLVVLHQWMCLLLICPEPFANQILAIIGPAKQLLAATIADARRSSARGCTCCKSRRNPDTSAGRPAGSIRSSAFGADLDDEQADRPSFICSERFRLRNGSRIAIQNESVLAVFAAESVRRQCR